jgi:hypothetical protein
VPGKNVALRREAVELLDREKRPGESYSDVVLRLGGGGSRPSLAALADFLESLPAVPDDDLDSRLALIRRDGRRTWARRGRA